MANELRNTMHRPAWSAQATSGTYYTSIRLLPVNYIPNPTRLSSSGKLYSPGEFCDP